MAWFFERFVYNKRLQLAHEEYVRPLEIGTNWNSIRIAVRFCINDSARSATTANISTPCLYMGVRQGSTGPSLFSDSLVDWIGAGHIGNTFPPTGPTAAFNASTPNYFSGVGRPNAMRKTGATTTFGSESSVNVFWVGSGQPGAYGAGFMSYAVVDIIKGSPNYSFNIYYANAIGQVQVNITDSIFIANLETTATPANLTSAGAAKTIAYSGDGLFDTLSIAAWRSFPHLEIDMLGVSRFA